MPFGLWRATAFVSSPIHLLMISWSQQRQTDRQTSRHREGAYSGPSLISRMRTAWSVRNSFSCGYRTWTGSARSTASSSTYMFTTPATTRHWNPQSSGTADCGAYGSSLSTGLPAQLHSVTVLTYLLTYLYGHLLLFFAWHCNVPL